MKSDNYRARLYVIMQTCNLSPFRKSTAGWATSTSASSQSGKCSEQGLWIQRRYYSGEATAPVLTIIIGGNHEASNYMWEL